MRKKMQIESNTVSPSKLSSEAGLGDEAGFSADAEITDLPKKGKKRTASISIMYTDHEIAIGREVVRLLATPKFEKPGYITIMMNWEERTMALLACDEKTPTSFKVPEKFLVDSNCGFRIYSAAFVNELEMRLNIDKEKRNYYRGSYNESLHAVVFQL